MVGKLQPSGEHKITNGKNKQGLDNKGNGDPQNRQRIADDDFPLEGEQQNQCQQQRRNTDGSKPMEKLIIEPVDPLGLNDPFS